MTDERRRYWTELNGHEMRSLLGFIIEQGLLENDREGELIVTVLGEEYLASDEPLQFSEPVTFEVSETGQGGSMKIRVLEHPDEDVLDSLEAMCRATQSELTGKGVIFGWAICDAHDHVLREG